MDSKLQTEAYLSFFGSESGKEFIKHVEGLIESVHKDAESDAEAARDKAQEARGIRRVLEHITVITAKKERL